MANKNYRFETLQLHVGQEQADPATDSRAVPIYQTTSYVFHNFDHAEARFGLADPGNIYGRLTNSTQGVFETASRPSRRHRGPGRRVRRGRRGIRGAQHHPVRRPHRRSQERVRRHLQPAAPHPAAPTALTTTFRLRPRTRRSSRRHPGEHQARLLRDLRQPDADLPDFEAITAIAHKHHLPVIVDNTFASPYLFRPLEHAPTSLWNPPPSSSAATAPPSGGVIVEGGKFNWAEVPGKFPTLTEPDPSYHGLNFYEALGGAAS